jgi:hypothetical protein
VGFYKRSGPDYRLPKKSEHTSLFFKNHAEKIKGKRKGEGGREREREKKGACPPRRGFYLACLFSLVD